MCEEVLSDMEEFGVINVALTVLPQPQLQGASGTVIAARFELLVSHSLN